MNKYTSVEIELIELSQSDIITTSIITGGDGENEGSGSDIF